MTAVEWLVEQFEKNGYLGIQRIEQAKQMEKEQILEDLIAFQIYLNDKGLITNHDWDFEKMAKLYLKKEYGK